ncbi:hypothetical protein HDU93_003743 [Gonapodya sp. JEL0774]|nr:hypothetical protein HDU93_003743 [Gonapodya sp. JEL0774]
MSPSPSTLPSRSSQTTFEVSGFSPSSTPGQRFLSGPGDSKVSFPLVLQSDLGTTLDDSLAAIREKLGFLKKALRDHGAILFRGIPGLETAQAFDKFGHSWNLEQYEYIGGAAPRTSIFGSVFTTNEGPADRPIAFHNEVAQSVDPPGVIMFYCDNPAVEGGETGIVHGAEAFERVSSAMPKFLEKLQTKILTPLGTTGVGGWIRTMSRTERKQKWVPVPRPADVQR